MIQNKEKFNLDLYKKQKIASLRGMEIKVTSTICRTIEKCDSIDAVDDYFRRVIDKVFKENARKNKGKGADRRRKKNKPKSKLSKGYCEKKYLLLKDFGINVTPEIQAKMESLNNEIAIDIYCKSLINKKLER